MTKALSIVLSLCALVLTGALLFVSWHLTQTLDTAHTALWNISAAAYNAQPTLQHVNDATGVWAKASQKQADAADELLRDLRAETWHVDRTLTTFNEQMVHVGPLLDSLRAESDELKKTTSAATQLTQQATVTLKTVNDGTGPLLNAYTSTGRDFDALLKSPELLDSLSNIQFTTQNVAGITKDFQMVTDKAREDYLKPKTPWKRLGGAIWDAYSIAGWAARH